MKLYTFHLKNFNKLLLPEEVVFAVFAFFEAAGFLSLEISFLFFSGLTPLQNIPWRLISKELKLLKLISHTGHDSKGVNGGDTTVSLLFKEVGVGEAIS